jgi:hypothetical protein
MNFKLNRAFKYVAADMRRRKPDAESHDAIRLLTSTATGIGSVL